MYDYVGSRLRKTLGSERLVTGNNGRGDMPFAATLAWAYDWCALCTDNNARVLGSCLFFSQDILG